MTKKEVLDFYTGLINAKGFPGAKFNYAITRNKKHLEPEIDALKEAYQASEDFLKYEKERIDLCLEMCKKDEDNNPVLIGEGSQQRYDFEDHKEFTDKVKELQKEHEVAIALREKQEEDYYKILEEEVEVDIYKINIDLCPDEAGELLDALYPMIDAE